MRAFVVLIALEVCLSAVALAEADQVRPRPTPESIGNQIAALSSADPGARAMAACYLATWGDRAEAAVPALLRLLADATPIAPVQCWSDRSTPGLEAARALGSIRSEAAIELLLEALRSPDPNLRRTAARALGLMMRRRR